jgi:hypothetical protein
MFVVAISLQASSLSQKTLLVIGDQIDAKRGNELMVCSVEISQCGVWAGAQTTLVDLDADFTRGIPVHQITEPVEPVLKQCMVGCNSFMHIKGCLDVHQGDTQLPAEFRNCNRLWIVLRKVMKNSQQDAVLLKRIQRTWPMGVIVDVTQLILLSPLSLIRKRRFLQARGLFSALGDSL